MVFIGIDPGVSGGLACVDENGAFVESFKMPTTERDLLDVMELIGLGTGGSHIRRAVLERVNAGVFGHGKAGRMGVTSAFTFGKGVGGLLVALTAAKIPFDEVSPVTWQKALGCLSHGDKNVTKRRAQQLFPSVGTITHAIADALLLAEYARRLERSRRYEKEARQGRSEKEGQAEKAQPSPGAHPAVDAAPRHGTRPKQAAR